jgi:hypothetical protein
MKRGDEIARGSGQSTIEITDDRKLLLRAPKAARPPRRQEA